MSRRFHRMLRVFLSGAAALCAYTVVITSRPALPPASASSERVVRRPAPALQTPVERGWTQARAGVPDPRARLFLLRR